MQVQNNIITDPAARPQRVRLLAEIPIETYRAIDRDLKNVPEWHLYFIKNNPDGWPEGMCEVLKRYLGPSVAQLCA